MEPRDVYAYLNCLPLIVVTVNVEIDGFINLGPNWNYEYKIKTHREGATPIVIEHKKHTDVSKASVVAKREGKDIDKHGHQTKVHFSVTLMKYMTMEEIKKNTESTVGNKIGNKKHKHEIKTDEAAKREEKDVGHHEHQTKAHVNETPLKYKHMTQAILEEITTTENSKIGTKKHRHAFEVNANELAKRERNDIGNSEQKAITNADQMTKAILEEITIPVDLNIGKTKKHHKITHLDVTEVEYSQTKSHTKRIRAFKLFHEPRSVKGDKHINNFAVHVYKQTMRVFDVIKKKVDPRYEHKVDQLARSYDEKFSSFVNETLNQKIKTRLGDQKVVLNTIETSNRLLKRLVNYFVSQLDKDGFSNNHAIANVLQKEVEKESTLEYKRACSKFGICRTAKGFNSFMVDVFTILLSCDDKKIKQACDALTEVLKNTDFSDIMEEHTQVDFRLQLEKVEYYDADLCRGMFAGLKNMHALQNQPLKVMVKDILAHVNSTVAFYEVLDEWEKAIPPNEQNVLKWSEIKNSLADWREGKRNDILGTMKRLFKHIHNAAKKMDAVKRQDMKHSLNIVLDFRSHNI